MPQPNGYGPNGYDQSPRARPSVRRQQSRQFAQMQQYQGGYQPTRQPVRPIRRRRRGGGCLVAVVALLLVAVALAAVLAFARPVLAQLGILDYLPESVVELIPAAPDEGALTERDHERLDAKLSDGYAYGHLGADDQARYRVMYDALSSREQRQYEYEGPDGLARIRNCIIADHPELFYVSGVNAHTITSNSLLGESSTTFVEGIYRYDEDEAKKLRRKLDEIAVACVDRIPSGADDYQKAKFLYEFVVENVEYDLDSYGVATSGAGGGENEGYGQTAVDALVDGKAVCAGYASAFQYLAQQADLPCLYVTGEARGEAHAWNVVKLDGEWYHVDATWGDPQFVQEDGASADVAHVNYDYLAVTTSDVLRDHSIDSDVPMPECTATTDNYYLREGRYFEEADAEAAGSLVRAAAERGDSSVQFRCATQGVYDSLRYELFDLGEVYSYLENDSCWYTSDDNQLSITIIF